MPGSSGVAATSATVTPSSRNAAAVTGPTETTFAPSSSVIASGTCVTKFRAVFRSRSKPRPRPRPLLDGTQRSQQRGGMPRHAAAISDGQHIAAARRGGSPGPIADGPAAARTWIQRFPSRPRSRNAVTISLAAGFGRHDRPERFPRSRQAEAVLGPTGRRSFPPAPARHDPRRPARRTTPPPRPCSRRSPPSCPPTPATASRSACGIPRRLDLQARHPPPRPHPGRRTDRPKTTRSPGGASPRPVAHAAGVARANRSRRGAAPLRRPRVRRAPGSPRRRSPIRRVVSSVATTVCWIPRVPQRTTAAGVVASRPASMSRCAFSRAFWTLIIRTIVPADGRDGSTATDKPSLVVGFEAGHERDRWRVVAVRHGNARRFGRGDRRAHAGHELEVDPRRPQHLRLLGTAPRTCTGRRP